MGEVSTTLTVVGNLKVPNPRTPKSRGGVSTTLMLGGRLQLTTWNQELTHYAPSFNKPQSCWWFEKHDLLIFK
ncbi:MAG: hypothetical protein KAF91_00065 [Nostoc sp. TH1S01]|nr:hypothetical protein [Nostoc sp. TH1S01]